jgi:hypothetical protein
LKFIDSELRDVCNRHRPHLTLEGLVFPEYPKGYKNTILIRANQKGKLFGQEVEAFQELYRFF